MNEDSKSGNHDPVQHPAPLGTASPPPTTGSTGAGEMHGQGILHRVQAHKARLTERLALLRGVPAVDPLHTRAVAIEEAIAAVEGLLTSNLDDIHPVTAFALNQWLETSKNLIEETSYAEPSSLPAREAPVDETDDDAGMTTMRVRESH